MAEATVPKYQLMIDGEWVSASDGGTRVIVNPATGEPLAEVAEAGPADVDRAVQAAHRAWREGPWARMNTRERSRILARLASLIRDHAEELARLESENTGKPIREARGGVFLTADCFDYYAGTIDKAGGQTIPVAAAGTALTWRVPVGVCALIAPWNFPLPITSWKVAPALAMGNAAVLKPASQTPLTALRLASLALEAGVPPGVLNVIPGPGGSTGDALVRHPLVRKVSFTGSTEVGTRVMQMAADGIKRVTLELGGKSANLVFADADLERAVPSAIWSALENAGQDCCARSRVFVQRPIYDRFVEKLTEAVKGIKIGLPLHEETEMGSLISLSHRDRVRSYVDIGVAEGAELVYGGDVPTSGELAKGAYLRPAIFTKVNSDMRIMREEIFGPVLCVAPFDTEEDAIRYANDSLYGLSGSIWTRDIGTALRVARAVETGVLSINSGHSVHLEAPFGGFKQSGLGRELGMAALDHYSELRTVFISTER